MATGSGKSKKRTTKSKSGSTRSTAKKTTSSSIKKAGQMDTGEIRNKESARMKAQIALVIAVALGIILFLINFGVIDTTPAKYVRYFMFGILGLMAYFLPFILVFITWFIAYTDGEEGLTTRRIIASAVLFVSVCTLIHTIVYSDRVKFLDLYSKCASVKNGGGLLGGMFALFFVMLLSKVGAIIITVAIVLIAAMFTVAKPINEWFSIDKERFNFKGGLRDDEEEDEYEYEEEPRRNEKAKKPVNTRENKPQKEVPEKKVHSGVEITTFEEFTPSGEILKDEKTEEEELAAKFLNVDLSKPKKRELEKKRGVEIITMRDENAPSPEMTEVGSAQSEIQKIRNASIFRGHVDVDNLMDNPKSEFGITDDIYEGPGVTDKTSLVGFGTNVTENRENTAASDMEPVTWHKPSDDFESKVDKIVPGSTMNKEIQNDPDALQDVAKRSVASVSRPARETNVNRGYELPKLSLLARGKSSKTAANEKELRDTAARLVKVLSNFGVNVRVTDYCKGPSVTRFEIQPETGTKLAKITSLADEIKFELAAADLRIEAPIAGKQAVGIEVPNKVRESVLIRDLIDSDELKKTSAKLAFAAGKDIAGNVVVADIAKMPHMLVAGTTGSGKSVFTNSIIMNILFRATPDEVRLLIIDPKVVEFQVYNGIPHLIHDVVTDPKEASGVLKWAVNEMQNRYKTFAANNVRDIKGYNEKVESGEACALEDGAPAIKMPQILIVIDELADLMMVARSEVEASICRIAQLARAAGIHMIIATQRPSADIVTGLIRGNIPSRTALSVATAVDSRIILDQAGAETLLGNGDMLFNPAGYKNPVRLQGSYVSDTEILNVVDHWKKQSFGDNTDPGINKFVVSESSDGLSAGGDGNEYDDLFADAGRTFIESGKASIGFLQRKYKIGFNRAARIVDQLCEAGVIGAGNGSKTRDIYMGMSDFESFCDSHL